MKELYTQNFPIKKLMIDEVEVSYEPAFFSLSKTLSKKEQKAFASLVEEAQVSPKTAYKKALTWNRTSPELNNLLAYLHIHHKKVGLAERLTKESFETYPEYFFARVNYADQCLRKNDLEVFHTIFPSFSLKELFPERRSFHVSEFRGFMTLISHYYIKVRNLPLASAYFAKAYEADPLHPSVLFLEKKLHKKQRFTKLLSRLRKLSRLSS